MKIKISKHCLMAVHITNLVIGVHIMTFNNTIICFFTKLPAHSLLKLNMKGAEINSQSKCKVPIPEVLIN